MARVLVRYYGILKEIAGKRQEIFEIEGSASLLDLIKLVSVRNGPRFQNFIYNKNGRLSEGLAFAMDGLSVQRSFLGKIKSQSVAEFVILPPISGGT